jgi:hypothetical protein
MAIRESNHSPSMIDHLANEPIPHRGILPSTTPTRRGWLTWSTLPLFLAVPGPVVATGGARARGGRTPAKVPHVHPLAAQVDDNHRCGWHGPNPGPRDRWSRWPWRQTHEELNCPRDPLEPLRPPVALVLWRVCVAVGMALKSHFSVLCFQLFLVLIQELAAVVVRPLGSSFVVRYPMEARMSSEFAQPRVSDSISSHNHSIPQERENPFTMYNARGIVGG